MAEIDDTELERLRRAQALLNELTTSPKTKREAERLLKVHHPEVITTDDLDAPVMDAIKGIGKKVDEFLAAQKTSADDGRLDAAFNDLRTNHGYTDDGIDKIKRLMVDRNTADPHVAAAFYEKTNPPPAPQRPSSFAGTGWGFGAKHEEPDTKLLFEDEDAFAEQEANKFFQELGAQK